MVTGRYLRVGRPFPESATYKRIAMSGLAGDTSHRPYPDDVPHRQQADDFVPLDDDEVPEAAADHRDRGLLQRPCPRREHQVLRAMLAGELGVRVLPGGDRVQDV